MPRVNSEYICMYVCLDVSIHVRIHTCMYGWPMNLYMYGHVCRHTYRWIHTCMDGVYGWIHTCMDSICRQPWEDCMGACYEGNEVTFRVMFLPNVKKMNSGIHPSHAFLSKYWDECMQTCSLRMMKKSWKQMNKDKLWDECIFDVRSNSYIIWRKK